jgi:hypothetical protein
MVQRPGKGVPASDAESGNGDHQRQQPKRWQNILPRGGFEPLYLPDLLSCISDRAPVGFEMQFTAISGEAAAELSAVAAAIVMEWSDMGPRLNPNGIRRD